MSQLDLPDPSPRRPGRRVTLDTGAGPNLALDEIPDGGIYPLDSPGMPLPGPDFLEHASALTGAEAFVKEKVLQPNGRKRTVERLNASEKLVGLMTSALRQPGFSMPIRIRNDLPKVELEFVPGHVWGQHYEAFMDGDDLPVDGPHRTEVMVVGKWPGRTELERRRCLVGPSGEVLRDVLSKFHVLGTRDWYITNLIKFAPPEGYSGAVPARWLDDCLPLLHQELRIVRPRFILCLGSDASKALLGKQYGVNYMDGRVAEYTYQVNHLPLPKDHPVDERTALVMSVVHPAAVARSPELARQLERGIGRFNQLINGVRFDREEKDLDHRTVRTYEELESLLHEIDHDPEKTDKWIAVDAEWHGEHPVNKGSYLRTIQLAWRPKHAAAIVLTAPGGQWVFTDARGSSPAEVRRRMVDLLNGFFKGKRVCGHFLVADLEWLLHIGLREVYNAFRVPLYPAEFDRLTPRTREAYAAVWGYGPGDAVEPWARTTFEGGWDTGLAAHAIEETALLGLEALTVRYTSVPRYDIPLHNWKEAYCKERGIKAKDLEGYGECPEEILIPYGIFDADATLRLMYEQHPLVDDDYEGNCCRESFWESMITVGPILEIHRNGITVDKALIDEQTLRFMDARNAQEKQIRDWAGWADFNIRSLQEVREFLYGENYNGKRTKEGGVVRLRPEGARSLHLRPILDTGKPPQRWDKIREKREEATHTPGTGKTVLGVLAQDRAKEQPQIQWIRDHRFLDQVLKSILRPPKTDEKGAIINVDPGQAELVEVDPGEGGTPFLVDNMGGMIFEAGLASVICSDGRVRTHLYPTAETKRWRSARPNLQNISKQRDPDYARILGKENYKRSLRAIFKASPGMALIEADYISAELFGMAIMSGDHALLDHCARNQLPEDHADFYDIHSNTAVAAFGLKCAPTKAGLKGIGKLSLRTAAKNVLFGLAYGRGAAAIALQCKEQGNPITTSDAQQTIDAVLARYPGLVPFFAEARLRSADPGWLCSCFGAFRRFPVTGDKAMQSEFERQAMNFGIQSMIASAVDRAIAYLQDYRDVVLGDPGYFRILLQIHDAILLEAPYANVRHIAEHVLPFNMGERVSIYQTDLGGEPTGAGPYHLGVDVEAFHAWGEKLSIEECEKLAAEAA